MNCMPQLFDADQIALLRKHYAGIHRVEPNSELWLSFVGFVRGLMGSLVTQIADANIDWLSTVARQELIRRKAYAAAQAGGMNETDSNEFAQDQASRT